MPPKSTIQPTVLILLGLPCVHLFVCNAVNGAWETISNGWWSLLVVLLMLYLSKKGDGGGATSCVTLLWPALQEMMLFAVENGYHLLKQAVL